MADDKKRIKKTAAKQVNVEALKIGILNDVKAMEDEKKRNDPVNILLSITDEIQAMFSTGITVQKQIQILKNNGLNINSKIYKEHVEGMGYGK